MDVIKASEISDFLYCERFWWLSRRNYFGKLSVNDTLSRVERLELGNRYHGEYFGAVRSTTRKTGAALRLIVAASTVLLVVLLILLFLAKAHGQSVGVQKRKVGSSFGATKEKPAEG